MGGGFGAMGDTFNGDEVTEGYYDIRSYPHTYPGSGSVLAARPVDTVGHDLLTGKDIQVAEWFECNEDIAVLAGYLPGQNNLPEAVPT